VELHPAENRGYRELYLTASAVARRFGHLASAFGAGDAHEALTKAGESLERMVAELRPLTARHGLYSRLAAEGGGASIGTARGTIADRFLERNQALRTATDELEHVATLLTYLNAVSGTRRDAELCEFTEAWERRLRRQLGAVRAAVRELGADPDEAVRPLDDSPVGRAAHRTAWTVGAIGEWTDRRVGRRGR
jgi:hypothetical protein